jgi:hypothetical protein
MAQRAHPYLPEVGRLALRGAPPASSGRNRLRDARKITPYPTDNFAEARTNATARGISRQGALDLVNPLIEARLVKRVGSKKSGRYILA